MYKYSRLINTRRTTFNFTGDACKFHDGLQKSRHRYIENLGAFNVDEARLITLSYTIQSPERRTSVSERQTHQPRAQISERMARKLKNRLPSQIRGEYEAHSQRDITDGKRHLEKLAYSVRRQPARFRVSGAISEEFDIAGHHFNTAISARGVLNSSLATRTEQNIYKTEFSLAKIANTLLSHTQHLVAHLAQTLSIWAVHPTTIGRRTIMLSTEIMNTVCPTTASRLVKRCGKRHRDGAEIEAPHIQQTLVRIRQIH